MPVMGRVGRTILLVFTVCQLGCSYAEPVDRSAIESAVLVPGTGGMIALAFQNIRYRPAAGIAAFPDGGIPRYLRDHEIIAVQSLDGGGPRILQRLENKGVHGSAGIALRSFDADPDHVLVRRSFQPSTSQSDQVAWWRLSWREGRILSYPDLAADLKNDGRTLGSPEFGDIRVIDSDGTLLIGARVGGQDELWLRPATGAYRRLDAFTHFYGIQGDELYYWTGNQAVVRNWRTDARRIIAQYDPAQRQTTRLLPNDPTVRALERTNPQPSVQISFRGQDLSVTREARTTVFSMRALTSR
jgi:hypothetical protein